MVTAPDAIASEIYIQAVAAHEAGHTDEAAALFRKTLEQFPNNSSVLHSLAFTYQAASRFPEAIAAWNEATDVDEEDMVAFANLMYCRTVYARTLMGVL